MSDLLGKQLCGSKWLRLLHRLNLYPYRQPRPTAIVAEVWLDGR
jgi:hypothetical protein